MALEITSENFTEEVLESEKTVLLDFWASWCGPCRFLAPVIDEIAEESTEIKVGKVNVDDEGELAEKFGIQNIPTLLVFKKGEVTAKAVGVKPKEFILDLCQ